MARVSLASALGSILALAPLGPTLPQPSTPDPAPCAARDPVTAEINAREGIKLARAEDFAAAEALFLTATRLDPCTAKYRYLLGRALERQDDFDGAAAAYEAVIERFPTSIEFTRAQGALVKMQVRRVAVEKAAEEEARRAKARRQAELKRQADRERQAKLDRQAELERQAELARQRSPWGPIGWSTAGLGVAAVAAGVGFSLAAQEADEALTVAATRPDRARYDALVDEREALSTLGWTGYGVGAALLVGGLVMVLVDGSTPTLTPTEGGTAVGFSGRF